MTATADGVDTRSVSPRRQLEAQIRLAHKRVAKAEGLWTLDFSSKHKDKLARRRQELANLIAQLHALD